MSTKETIDHALSLATAFEDLRDLIGDQELSSNTERNNLYNALIYFATMAKENTMLPESDTFEIFAEIIKDTPTIEDQINGDIK